MDNPPPAADNGDLHADPTTAADGAARDGAAGDGSAWPGDGAAADGAAGAPPPPPDPAALFLLLDALRLTAPPELQDRLAALLREALLTLRALIDHYLDRLDATPAEHKVEDIPID